MACARSRYSIVKNGLSVSSESDRGDYFGGDTVRGETRWEGGGLKLPFHIC